MSPTRHRLVLFDFDGTLADSFAWFAGAWNELAGELRFRRLEPEEIETLRGWDARRIARHVGLPWWKLPAVARRMRQLVARDAARIRPFPGVDALLRRLHAGGIGLGIVTSNAEANVRRILGEETASLVQHWECGTSLFGKAARFRRVLRASGLPGGAVLAVGDELRDQAAAVKAGIDFGAVSWGFSTRAALEAGGAALVFDRVEEIAERLLAP